MMISEFAVGADVRIVCVELDKSQERRMRELGLGPGTRAKVVQRAAFGGRVLAILGQRIALDAGTAKKIKAEIVTNAMPAATAIVSATAAQCEPVSSSSAVPATAAA